MLRQVLGKSINLSCNSEVWGASWACSQLNVGGESYWRWERGYSGYSLVPERKKDSKRVCRLTQSTLLTTSYQGVRWCPDSLALCYWTWQCEDLWVSLPRTAVFLFSSLVLVRSFSSSWSALCLYEKRLTGGNLALSVLTQGHHYFLMLPLVQPLVALQAGSCPFCPSLLPCPGRCCGGQSCLSFWLHLE